jgi:hypothetical protein
VTVNWDARWPGDSKEGTTINATVDDHDSDIRCGAVYHDERVRVDKVRHLNGEKKRCLMEI